MVQKSLWWQVAVFYLVITPPQPLLQSIYDLILRVVISL